jgi:predicted MFS family arabinose efflux permease
MRGLVAFVCLVVFVDTVFYAAITPILPELSDEYGLSKTAAGVLAATYPAGTFLGALPGGWLAARAGTRPTVLLGLGLLVSSSIVFAFADSIVVLDVARFIQGVGGAASWAGALGWLIGAAPRERRGELIGTALAAAIVGALFGPVLGAAAGALGHAPVFAAVAGMGAAMMAWALRLRAAEPEGDSRLRTLLTALGDRRVAAGMWLTALPGVLFGTVAVLVPLRMDELGAGAAAIAAAWVVAGALEAIINPLVGRLSDRRGRLVPSIAGVAGGALVMLAFPWPNSAWALGGLVIVAAPLIGTLWTPAMAMLSDGAEAFGVAQGFAFALVNLAWATGQTAGAAGSGRLADAVGDRVPYLVLAGVCALTLAALVRRLRSPEAGKDVAHGFSSS